MAGPSIRRWVLALTVLTTLLTPQSRAGDEPKKKPNVVFILADDMRRDAIAGMGNANIATPNLDKLMKRGTTFTRAYIQGSLSGAVCMPSRQMIHTGRSFLKTPLDMKGRITLGELLRRAGYATFAIGKWHNGPDSWLRSFEAGNMILFDGMADHFNVPFQTPTGDDKFKRVDAKGKHSSEVIADAAIDYLKRRAEARKLPKSPETSEVLQTAGRPFFLYVAFTAPHDPRDAPEKYREVYYKKKPPIPTNFLPQHPFDNGEVTGRDEVLAPWPRTEAVIQDQLAEYYALIMHMDEQIGRLLEALEASGEMDNTIIIFAADNGLALGSHGLVGKQSVYEHSVGVPLMFAGPGVPKNQKRDAMVYLLDIFPTVCEMTGVEMPNDLDGISLKKVIAGQQPGVRESLYFNYKHLQRSVREDRWKLIVYPQINHQQLFDLKNDPDEIHDLSGKAEHAKRIVELKSLLLKWEKNLGLKEMPLTVANPRPKQIDLTREPRNPDRWQPDWIRKKYFAK